MTVVLFMLFCLVLLLVDGCPEMLTWFLSASRHD